MGSGSKLGRWRCVFREEKGLYTLGVSLCQHENIRSRQLPSPSPNIDILILLSLRKYQIGKPN